MAIKPLTLEDLAHKIDTNNSNLLELIDGLAVSMSKGFEAVDERFDKVERHITAEIRDLRQELHQEISRMNEKIDQITKMVSEDVEAAYRDIQKLKDESVSIQHKIKLLEHHVDRLVGKS